MLFVQLIGLFSVMIIGIVIIANIFIYIMRWSDDRTNRFNKIDLD